METLRQVSINGAEDITLTQLGHPKDRRVGFNPFGTQGKDGSFRHIVSITVGLRSVVVSEIAAPHHDELRMVTPRLSHTAPIICDWSAHTDSSGNGA